MTFAAWQQSFAGIPGSVPGVLIPAAGLALFAWLVRRELSPLFSARAAPWKDRPASRLKNLARFGLLQGGQFRYPLQATAHSLIFYGFLFSLPHLLVMVCLGLPGFREPSGQLWQAYGALCDVAATGIIAGCLLAAFCRLGPYKSRYPANRASGAFGILALVAALTLTQTLHRAALLSAASASLPPFTIAALASGLARALLPDGATAVAAWSWLGHELLFFGFLCVLPVSKQFHELLGLISLWCMRLDKGALQPCRHGLTEAQTDELSSIGTASMSDLSWVQMLRHYTCADCGRCSGNCPATLTGKTLSPREFMYEGRKALASGATATPWNSAEIWDCAVCGACEEECPLGIGHIDTIVDLRRHAVEKGDVPLGISRAMETLQRTASPVIQEPGLPPWPGNTEFEALAEKKGGLLFLPSSLTTVDPLAMSSASAVCRLLIQAGHDVALLPGPAVDTGHEARRWGDEYLFRQLRDALLARIALAAPAAVVTEDPHTLNALRNDYNLALPVRHSSEILAEDLAAGRLRIAAQARKRVFVFHDPCYLGRHGGVYAPPPPDLTRGGFRVARASPDQRQGFVLWRPNDLFPRTGGKTATCLFAPQ